MLGTQEGTGISWKDFRNMLRNEKKMGGKERGKIRVPWEEQCLQARGDIL